MTFENLPGWRFALLFLVALAPALGSGCERGETAAAMHTAWGVVAEVRRVDTSPLGGDAILLVSLDDGRVFNLPGADTLAAGSGVELEIRYLASAAPDAVPTACSVRVVAVPVTMDGEDTLLPASNPFEIYGNADPACAEKKRYN